MKNNKTMPLDEAHSAKRTRYAVASPDSDSRCWTCHQDEPELCCISCVRSFHDSAMCCRSNRPSAEDVGPWRCPECIAIQKDKEQIRSKQIDTVHLNKVLQFVFNQLQKDEYLTEAFMDIDYSVITPEVVNPIDLNKIGKRIESAAYSCYESFLSDVKWIVHNIKAFWSDDKDTLEAARWLLKVTNEEIYSVRMCDECHINLIQNGFEKVCKQPHLLVWAKQKTYPYWPAKLMSVNIERNTVDVRYFGGEHFRAVLSPKDCFMYSEISPSAHSVGNKQAIMEAKKEADCYMQNLSMKYRYFNYAAPKTLLHVDMLERHLYDMIPNAWKELGKNVIPKPIPKPVPASATMARRQSVPVRKITAPIMPVSISGRIMTRRMSMLFEPTTSQDIVSAAKNIGTGRRQSIQQDEMRVGNTTIKKVTPIPKAMNLNQTKGTTKSSTKDLGKTTSNQANDSPFKVPEIPSPRKVRKLSSNSSTYLHPAIIENTRALNEASMSPDKTNVSPSKKPTPIDRSPSKNSRRNLNDRSPQMEAHKDSAVHSPEMVKLCNAVIERNTSKVTECIRSSLEAALEECLNITKPKQQLHELQSQLNKLQTDYNIRIRDLQAQNDALKKRLNTINSENEQLIRKNDEISKKNVELTDTIDGMKSKNALLTADLKIAFEKNSRLVTNFNSSARECREVRSKVTDIQVDNSQKDQQLKHLQRKNGELKRMYEVLMRTNTEHRSELQRISLANQTLNRQILELKNDKMQMFYDSTEFSLN